MEIISNICKQFAQFIIVYPHQNIFKLFFKWMELLQLEIAMDMSSFIKFHKFQNSRPRLITILGVL